MIIELNKIIYFCVNMAHICMHEPDIFTTTIIVYLETMKILCGQLNAQCVQPANILIRCPSHPQGTFTLRMTRAASQNIGKLYTKH